MLDAERADRLAPVVLDILRDMPTNFLIFDEETDIIRWPGMNSFPSTIDGYRGDIADILTTDPQILPEDNALIMFTSGMDTPSLMMQKNKLTCWMSRNHRFTERRFKHSTSVFDEYSKREWYLLIL